MVIYSSELYAKWIFKKKRIMTTCCVYAMCTSALVNDCEWFIQYRICLRLKYEERKHVKRCLYCTCVKCGEMWSYE